MLTLITLAFVILGAINTFIVGAFQKDVPALIFGGSDTIGARVIYIIVGLMSLWLIYILFFRRDVLSFKNDFNFKRKPRKPKRK